MRKIGDPLTTEGKGSTNKNPRIAKSFGYQVLGFGSGGGPSPAFTIATGGDATHTDGDYKVHVFTGDGTLTVSQVGNAPDFPGNPLAGPNTTEYLVVAGGGGCRVGGGGGGGFRTSYPGTPLQVAITAQGYPITVGGQNSDSVFSSITSAGGGYGSHYVHGPTPTPADPGGSGGGAGNNSGTRNGGAGNDPPTTPPQGNPGGNSGSGGPTITGGGGGGAGASGSTSPGSNGGDAGAGAGIADAFFGPNAPSYGEPGPAGRYFSGGGGGSGVSSGQTTSGGLGGGGNGGNAPGSEATAGSTNMGGGGGGQTNAPYGKPGGSGIVFIRYKFQ